METPGWHVTLLQALPVQGVEEERDEAQKLSEKHEGALHCRVLEVEFMTGLVMPHYSDVLQHISSMPYDV